MANTVRPEYLKSVYHLPATTSYPRMSDGATVTLRGGGVTPAKDPYPSIAIIEISQGGGDKLNAVLDKDEALKMAHAIIDGFAEHDAA